MRNHEERIAESDIGNAKSVFKRRKVVGVPQAAGDHTKQGWCCDLECGHSTVATGRQWLRPKTAFCPICP